MSRLLRRGTIHSVQNSTERRLAQQLLYREYRSRGYCAENSLEQHFNIYSILPSCNTLVMMDGADCRGTISEIPDSDFGLPMEKLYSQEVESLRRSGKKLAEIGLLALDGNRYSKGSYSLTSFRKIRDLFSLMQALYVRARRVTGTTDLLIVVHPRHENLYRYLGFEQIGPVRAYAGAEGNLALPMWLNLASFERSAEWNAAARFIVSYGDDLAKLDSVCRYSDSELLIGLSEHPSLWSGLNSDERRRLREMYPRLNEWSGLLDALHIPQLQQTNVGEGKGGYDAETILA